MEWILVETKLPGNHDKVIVTDGLRMGVAYRDGSGFVGFDEDFHIYPTHWMPLPNFPNQPERSKREDSDEQEDGCVCEEIGNCHCESCE